MRLIDADALEPDAEYDDGEFWAYSITQIENAPTIEPERKKGKWIDRGKDKVIRWECPECGRRDMYIYNYCPDCGLDMREGETE